MARNWEGTKWGAGEGNGVEGGKLKAEMVGERAEEAGRKGWQKGGRRGE